MPAESDIASFFKADNQRLLARSIKATHGGFDENGFLEAVLPKVGKLELKARMRHTSIILARFIPTDYEEAIAYLRPVAPNLATKFVGMVFTDFIEAFGEKHFETSMEAMEYFTKFGSAEFAVRVFLDQDFEAAMVYVNRWAKDDNTHVRRLATEGTRPRLPWSFQLKNLVADPTPAFDMLTTLSKDPELYVRKSVGNHLNDIAKDNVDLMFDLIEGWDHDNKHTKWIITRGLRSLVKKGHPKALAFHGFQENPQIDVNPLTLSSTAIQLGDKLEFEFTLKSTSRHDQKLAIDTIVHFLKKSGKQAEKVFKFRVLDLKAGETLTLKGKQPFKLITTRKLYSGEHGIQVMINGTRYDVADFDLVID
jgi:3-methyladenine DNA glycosylase AlkC